MGPSKKKEEKGFMALDHDNLWAKARVGSPTKTSAVEAFDKLVTKIVTEIGPIINILVFLPTHPSNIWAATYRKLGFFPVVCPRVPVKEGSEEEKDTVDETLTEYSEFAIEHIKELTFFVLCSGDQDFASLLRKAKRKGLKTVVVAGSTKSLSKELIDLADTTMLFELTEAG